MPGYHLEKLPDEPIVISVLHEDWDIESELSQIITELTAVFDTASQPLYFISDIVEISVDMQGMIAAANLVTRGDGALFQHPNLKVVLVVTQNKMLELAAKGVNSEVFGFAPTQVFTNREETLAYARSQN